MTNYEIPVRMDFDAHAPRFSKVMNTLDAASRQGDLDKGLAELVRIHASQINGCAYCVDMHTTDARAIGETEQRIYALPVWRETPFYTARERAALAFTEAVTTMTDGHVPQSAYDEVAAEYNQDEIAALVSLIVVINAWNAIGVSTRTW